MLEELKQEWAELMVWDPARTERQPLGREDIVAKYPLLTAAMVEYSTGYFNPLTAAAAISDAVQGRGNHCEWYADQRRVLLGQSQRQSMAEITRNNLLRCLKRLASEFDRPFYRNQLDQAVTWVRQEAEEIERRNKLTPALQAA